jgi:serine/threonine-protein kinase
MDPLTQLRSALADHYVIEREIGSGGMATVYLAHDLRHGRHVALKVLKPDLGAVLGVERFLSEIRVTANLQHPNLLPLFDSGEADGLLYYVMPFVEGESLRARLDREKQLPIDEAIRIAIAIANALDYAHAHGVIHRDLKPENILLQAGQPVIADFGIALAVSNAGGNRITQTGLSLGTPAYMSPEQATGDRVIDARSDIYSLGAMTYEMLTGEPPHTGNTAQSVIARMLTERPRPIRTTRAAVPEYVEATVQRALEKLPADRFSSVRELADGLRGRVDFVPRAPPRRWCRRRGDDAHGPNAGVIRSCSRSQRSRSGCSASSRCATGPLRRACGR